MSETSPEERLLRLGGQVRASDGAIVLTALTEWTREVEAQLKELRRPPVAYRRRAWWRHYTIQSYRLWRIAYRLGLTKEPW